MERSAGGDHEAFRELVERHQGMVRGVVFRMVPSSIDAEDLAQQIFFRVWKAAPRYRPEAKFTTWLMTITRNLVFNETKKRARLRWVSMSDPEPGSEIAGLAGPSDEAPDREAQAQELQEAVDAAIRELPENQRMALLLHRFEGLPHEEIAEILKTTVPATKSLIFRAREALRIKLARFLAACRTE